MCDIKVGDFWGIKDTDPYWNPKGVSVILAKTQKGVDALKALPNFLLCEITMPRQPLTMPDSWGILMTHC